MSISWPFHLPIGASRKIAERDITHNKKCAKPHIRLKISPRFVGAFCFSDLQCKEMISASILRRVIKNHASCLQCKSVVLTELTGQLIIHKLSIKKPHTWGD